MTRALPLLAAMVLLPLAGARAARGDGGELEGLLNEPVVSTASRSAQTAGLAPATTSVITAEDLRRYGLGSLDEAINFVALGMTVEPGPIFAEAGARGVLLTRDYGNHVLVLIDGHAVNEGWDGAAYFDRSLGFPLELVDHIEVSLGPGSVLYGSSAMLAVVNVITLRARALDGLHLAADGSWPLAGHGAASFGKELELWGLTGEVVAGVDYFQSRGPAVTLGPQDTGAKVWGGEATRRAVSVPSVYARFALGRFELDLRAATTRREAVSRAGSFDDPENHDGDRWLSLDARWQQPVTAAFRLDARLYGDLYRYRQLVPSFDAARECLAGQAAGCTYDLQGDSRWAGAEVTGSLDWLHDGATVTLVGVDARLTNVGQEERYWDAATGAPVPTSRFDRTDATAGVYLQQTARPLAWLSANAGLRLDGDRHFGTHLSPRAALVASPWEGGTLKAIYSEAFRAPTGFERYYSDPVSFVAAPGLAPEVVRSVEAVVEQRWGASRARLGAFRTWWSGLVVVDDATPAELAAAIAGGELAPGTAAASTYRNSERLDGWGLNADLEGSHLGQRLRWGAGLTWGRARTPAEAPAEPQRLPAAAELFGNARVSWDLGGERPVLGLAARFTGPRLVAGTRFDPVPEAKALLELRASASGRFPLVPGLSWRATAGWASAGRSAYAVGPLRVPVPAAGYTAQELAPQQQLTLQLGLRHDW